MAKTEKLNTLLALREKYETTFKNAVKDMLNTFKKEQGLFLGERKTYQALDGFADDATKRSFKKVASTVNEQFDWFNDSIKEYMLQLFSIEKTNGVGVAKAVLTVDGKEWGEFTSTELLRLKGFLENSTLKDMYSEIPVRSETILWEKSDDEIYTDRVGIFESPKDEGFAKTTIKESYILHDPHAKENASRTPIVGEKSTQVNIGQYSVQNYTGQASMRERAEMLRRLDVLHKAVVEALEKANDVSVVESTLGTKVFDFINKGK
jgi:hypothetical protein